MIDYLIVEDDDALRLTLSKALENRSFSVFSCSSIDECEVALSENSFFRAILDLKLANDESGLDVIAPILNNSKNTKIVVLTGYGNISSAVEAMRLGAVNYISKPAEVDAIIEAFESHPEALSYDPSKTDLETVEKEHIQKVLDECGGNISQAAKLLGLHRRSLQRKLQRLKASS